MRSDTLTIEELKILQAKYKDITKMQRKQNPTPKEKQIATEMQTPEKPQPIAKAGIFTSLLNQPTVDAAQLLGSDKTIWINSMEEINELFPTGGMFSRPFFVIRAWYFASKTANQKDRCGLKIALPDEQVYHISLSYPFNDAGEAIYPDRKVVLDHFETSSTPVGLMQFQKIDRGQANPYWRLIYSDEHSMELAGEAVSKAEKPGDDEPPF